MTTPRPTSAPRPAPVPLRTRLGVLAGAGAGSLSRVLGRGAGATLPGKVTLTVAPHALADLAAGRSSIIVTGTNGKTTTTAFLVAAMTPDGLSGDDDGVVTNATGANMATGIVSALAVSRAPLAVLETDELHVPAVMRAVRPTALVLLNLSRDQLDRTHEVRRAAELWRASIADATQPLTVVANAADPNIAYAVLDGSRPSTTVVWVDGGLQWFGDAELCPRCGELLVVDGGGWRCTCGLTQPEADYRIHRRAVSTSTSTPADGLPHGPLPVAESILELPAAADPLTSGTSGASSTSDIADAPRTSITVAPSLPGAANVSNAAFAIAAAAVVGISAEVAADRLASVGDVAGRYGSIPLGEPGRTRPTRMLLAKNPAGWTVALDLIEPDAVVALGVNARTQDGTDTSWLWDVPFEHLAGRTVGVFGERAADLELRLVHAGVTTVRAPGAGNVRDANALAATLPDGELTVLATYTAFQEVRRG